VAHPTTAAVVAEATIITSTTMLKAVVFVAMAMAMRIITIMVTVDAIAKKH
jgi:hypothetical protein